MRRYYYFGCRGDQVGHFLHGMTQTPRSGKLDGGFPVYLLDGTFAPVDSKDRAWRLTHLRHAGNILSILACHDNTIDKRPGSNACFVIVDSETWTAERILESAKNCFPDCAERLKDVPILARCI